MLRLLPLSVLIVVTLGAKLEFGTRPRLDGRIVGGKPVKIEEYPYQISLQSHGSHVCGGSIIGPNKILTAAHCTSGSSASSMTVRHSSTYRGSQGVVIKVAHIAQNPAYNPFDISNDVSVLTLTESIKESDIGKPIKLVEFNAVEGGRKAVCTGWGTLSSGGFLPLELQAVDVMEVNRTKCNKSYGGGITDTMICFGSPGKDSCQGDSGGPLVVDGKQVGIVSWGYGCADPDHPGVYAHVAALRNFIDKN
ncbi:trypsin alpha-like [Photinus pyralis]|uniref:Peptidase S1 domain-containing protein n=1 Tax=Photinus pyralis TaxID=7054 RepID=A0A1Y1KS52_PHOPY|nr:trypsin alpha-like [Photinus pyralis]